MCWKYLRWWNWQTPLSILLANEIQKLGKETVILRKYYDSHNDEYELIKNNFNNLIINKKELMAS